MIFPFCSSSRTLWEFCDWMSDWIVADSTGSAGRGTFGDRRNGFDQKEKKDVILQCFCNLYGLVLKQQKGELDMKTLKKVLLSSMLAISEWALCRLQRLMIVQ